MPCDDLVAVRACPSFDRAALILRAVERLALAPHDARNANVGVELHAAILVPAYCRVIRRRSRAGARDRPQAPGGLAREGAGVSFAAGVDAARESAAAALQAARERPATLLVGAFAAGVAAAPRNAALVLVAAAAALAVAGRRRAVLALALVAAVLGGALTAQLRLAALERPAAAVRDGTPTDGDATLLQSPRLWSFGVRAAIARIGALRVLVRAPPDVRWPRGELGAGDVVRVRGELRRLGPRDGWLRVRSCMPCSCRGGSPRPDAAAGVRPGSSTVCGGTRSGR